jgi:hypothetical protein
VFLYTPEMSQETFDALPRNRSTNKHKKALNLPEEPHDVEDGTSDSDGDDVPGGSEVVNTGSIGNDAEKSEAKPCQASSSSRWRDVGGRDEAMMTKKGRW